MLRKFLVNVWKHSAAFHSVWHHFIRLKQYAYQAGEQLHPSVLSWMASNADSLINVVFIGPKMNNLVILFDLILINKLGQPSWSDIHIVKHLVTNVWCANVLASRAEEATSTKAGTCIGPGSAIRAQHRRTLPCNLERLLRHQVKRTSEVRGQLRGYVWNSLYC